MRADFRTAGIVCAIQAAFGGKPRPLDYMPYVKAQYEMMRAPQTAEQEQEKAERMGRDILMFFGSLAAHGKKRGGVTSPKAAP